jgi:hypothetical protein
MSITDWGCFVMTVIAQLSSSYRPQEVLDLVVGYEKKTIVLILQFAHVQP